MASRPVATANVFAFAGCEADSQFGNAEAGTPAGAAYCYEEGKTWVENMADGLPQRCRDLPPIERCWAPEDKWVTFLNHKLASPFGVAAGPLLSSQWVALAASRGYDCLTYKTIRSHYHPGHGLPNIIHLDVNQQLAASGPACQEPLFAASTSTSTSTTTGGAADGAAGKNVDTRACGDAVSGAVGRAKDAVSGGSAVSTPTPTPTPTSDGCLPTLAITNSFGMPSQGPEALADDIPAAAAALRPGQMMVVSITGTPGRPGLSFAEDLHLAARAALAGGATALEVNLSCPNVGASHVTLYQDAPAVESLLSGLSQALQGPCASSSSGGGGGPAVPPLMIKVGAFPDADSLRRVMQAAERAGAGAVAGINGLSWRVELPGGGGPALGPDRPSSGVCGDPIRAAGLEFVRQAREVIAGDSLGLGLVGVGGVTQATHVMDYLEAGADVVQTATGFMWRPHLGADFQRLWRDAGYRVARADGRGGRG